jgi:hypothetical protein
VADEPIRITGLREFRRSLKRLDADAAQNMRYGFRDAASLIASTAKPKVPVGPAAGGHATSSIKASLSGTKVQVSEGGSRYRYMPWLDFGGRVGPNRSVVRPFRKKGRYIWAAFSDRHDEVLEKIQDTINDAARSAGLEVE